MLNTLLDTWGVRKNHSYQFLANVPEEVKTTISEGVKYIRNSIKAPKSKMGNAFFSGSFKIFKRTFPYFFPSNYVKDDKNRTLDPHSICLLISGGRT